MDQKRREDLWQFALEYYQEEQVAQILLVLQDEHNLKINMLILAVWLASANYRLNSLNGLEEAFSWHEEISSKVREKRKRLKDKQLQYDAKDSKIVRALEDSYRQLLAAELATEKVELLLLQSVFLERIDVDGPCQNIGTLLTENIKAYCTYEEDKKEDDLVLLAQRLEELIIISQTFFKNRIA